MHQGGCRCAAGATQIDIGEGGTSGLADMGKEEADRQTCGFHVSITKTDDCKL